LRDNFHARLFWRKYIGAERVSTEAFVEFLEDFLRHVLVLDPSDVETLLTVGNIVRIVATVDGAGGTGSTGNHGMVRVGCEGKRSR
jgi:hypothetical protein